MVKHPMVKCDACGTSPLFGNRYKCLMCPNYDLCENCFNNKTHSFHQFGIISTPGQMPMPIPMQNFVQPQYYPPQPQAHVGVKCNNCNASPIYGNRFKCTVCFNYDLCNNCKSMNVHPMHGFNLISTPGAGPVFIPAVQPQPIVQPPYFPNPSFPQPFVQIQTPETKVNVGVRCDQCGVNPIIGRRFKCMYCPNYDLCESCRNKGYHNQHQFNYLP